jgi:hypothetical protein
MTKRIYILINDPIFIQGFVQGPAPKPTLLNQPLN